MYGCRSDASTAIRDVVLRCCDGFGCEPAKVMFSSHLRHLQGEFDEIFKLGF